MNKVNNNSQSQAVSFIHQVLKIIWGSWSWGYSEKSSYMVTETGVIGMFLNRHQLDYIVACLFYSIQIIICKISVSTDSSKFLSHSYMSFIDSYTLIWLDNWSFMSPFKGLRRIPQNTVIKKSIFILHLVFRVSWVTIHSFTIRAFNVNFIFWIMRDSGSSILICFYCYHKCSKFIFSASEFFTIPSIKITKKCNTFCLWSPFSILAITVR